jgi:hypothetical protein
LYATKGEDRVKLVSIYHTGDEKPATRNMREKTVLEKTGF